MYIFRSFLFLVTLVLAVPALAQTDSTVVKVDSAYANPVSKKPKVTVPKDTTFVPLANEKSPVVKDSARLALEALPGKAAWSSAILPGLGQIKNGRWWKVPFIYGGLVSVGLAFEFNHRYYKEFLGELQYRQRTGEPLDPRYANHDDQALNSVKNFYRRNRDLSALGFLAVHAINIIDAYVDAKFFRYDISDKLGFQFQPSVIAVPSYASNTPVPVLKLVIPL